MESSLQNLSSSKKAITDEYISPINVNLDNNKEAMKNVTQKTTPISELNQKQLSDDGGVINISGNTDSLVNADSPQNGNIAEDGIFTEKNIESTSSKNDSILTPSDFKRIKDAETRAMEKIKDLMQNEKKEMNSKKLRTKR